ncbi:MAG: hypothetical protein JNL01_00875 [Bdellovibrionales bacterium]|nr:hypothetical protein [Bdellovibrionales bacterium]
MIRASEFQLDPAKIQIFLIQPLGAALQGFQAKIDEEPTWQGVLFDSVIEAIRTIRLVESCVILGHISDPNRFAEYLSLAKHLAPILRSGRMKMLLLYPREAAGRLPIERLQMYGVQDLLPEPVQERTILFKLTRAIKSMPKKLHQRDGTATVEASGKKGATQTIHQLDPISIQSEVFLLTSGGAKKVQDRWTIRLAGPAPQSGKWAEIDPRTEGQKSWQWNPADPAQDTLHKEEGAWTFSGQKPPEFSGEHWWFSGQKPLLEFVYDKQAYAKKFEVDETGALNVAKDSPQAPGILAEIQKTFKKMYRKADTGSAVTQIPVEPSFDGPVETESLGAASTPAQAQTAAADHSSAPSSQATGTLAQPSRVDTSDLGPQGDVDSILAGAATQAQFAPAVESDEPVLDLPDRVSALQMNFFASELIRKRTIPGVEMAKRFCGFISRGLSDPGRIVRVELWVEDQKKWVCISASDGKLSQLQISVRRANEHGGFEKDVLVSGTFTDESISWIGRLAIQGKGIKSLSPAHLKDLGEASCGIINSFLEDRDPKKRPAPNVTRP